MAITRLNHAVLYVRDVRRSVDFYTNVLGFRVVSDMAQMPGAAFLQAAESSNDHDLGLFEIGAGAGASLAGKQTVGLYHLAWEVDTLSELARMQTALSEAGALVGASDHSSTKALYGADPDGIEFEVSWLVPAEFVDDEVRAGRTRIRPLDIAKEIERYGAETRGGVGISHAAIG